MSSPYAGLSPHPPPPASFSLPPIHEQHHQHHHHDNHHHHAPHMKQYDPPASPTRQSLPSIDSLLTPRESFTSSHPSTTAAPAAPTQPPLTPQQPSKSLPAWNPHSPFSPGFSEKAPPAPLPAFDLTDPRAHRREMARGFLPSPPNSTELPLSHSFSSAKDDLHSQSADPALYRADTPATQGAESLALFATDPDVLLDADIDQHIAETTAHFSQHRTTPPSRQDYYCVARVFKVITEMGVPAYLDQEERFLNQYWGVKAPRPHSTSHGRKVLQHASGNRRQLKPLAPKASNESRRVASKAIPAARSPRAPRPSHRSSHPAVDEQGHPLPPRTKVVKPTEEYNFAQFPDYAPAPSTMKSGMYHANQIKWTGANSQSDLTNDPDRDHLSEPELIVASKLRLTCAKYLCQKRRIFIHLLDILRQGKEFKKTNCQDVRMIDVNKLSTLWVFYHAIGWFDRSHYEHLL